MPVKAVLADDSEPYDYIVQPGDTLERIAEKWLGGASEWPHLYQANRSRIKDPNSIKPGLKGCRTLSAIGASPSRRHPRPTLT